MISYEKYKTSSCDWIDSIPSHWDTHRVKMLFSLRDERNYKPLNKVNLISLYTSLGVRQHKDIEHTTGNKARNADGYKIVYPDDIVVNILLCWMGAIGRSDYYGVTSPAYDIYKPKTKSVNTKYYNYLMRTPMFAQQCYRAGKGIMAMRWRTYSPQFSNIVVPAPPVDEQDQIVRFLDWKVSSINKLIHVKQKQLVCIQERVNKQFEIVSKKSPQKAKLKYHVCLLNDFIELENNEYYKKTGMYNRGRGIFRRNEILGSDMGDSKFQRIHAGCVMISGQFAWEAATYVTTNEDKQGVVSHRYYLLKPKDNIPPEYIWCFLMSDYGQMLMKLCSHGAAGRNRPLNIKELLNTYFPIPQNSDELNLLVKNVQGLMMLRKNTLEQINTLKELRNRLISDVITGKIDVRGVEIPEYEYVDEDMTDTDEENENEELTEEQEE